MGLLISTNFAAVSPYEKFCIEELFTSNIEKLEIKPPDKSTYDSFSIDNVQYHIKFAERFEEQTNRINDLY